MQCERECGDMVHCNLVCAAPQQRREANLQAIYGATTDDTSRHEKGIPPMNSTYLSVLD